MRPVLAALTLLVASAAGGADPVRPPADESPAGLWVYPMSSWELGPEDLYEDGSRPQYASALLVNFCADGQLRIATGVLYANTHTRQAHLGVSDGLVLYLGRWKQQGPSVSVEYRVHSAEIRMITGDGTDRDSTTMSTAVRLRAGQLEFPFQYRGDPQTRMLTLIPAGKFDKEIDPEDGFIRCE